MTVSSIENRTTPGPWHLLADRGSVGGTSATGEPVMVADCFTSCVTGDRVTEDEMEANARLIAAAPEMLAAAKELLFMLGEHERIANLVHETAWFIAPIHRPMVDMARAIAKAEGQEP